MGRLNNFRSHANRWGWRRALAHLVARGAERYIGIHVYVVRLRKIPAEQQYPSSKPQLQFRRIENSEWSDLCSDPALKLDFEFTSSAIERGDLAFGAFDNQKLVSYIWRSRSSAPDADGIWIKVDPPYCYSYKSFTRNDYRGQHISPAVHLFSDQEMYQYNYRYRVGFVAITNYPSREMGKRMGSLELGYAGYISILGLFLPFRAKSIKAIRFSFFRPGGSPQKST